MSWESTSTNHVCPCGKGVYVVTDSSDDWGRTKTQWSMDCPSCKQKYALHTFGYYRHGMPSEGHRWIDRQKYEEAMKLSKEARDSKNLAVSLAKKRYLSALNGKFEGCSKKAIWEVLHAHIKWYKSLGTFYQHTKGKSSLEYLGELFSEDHLDAIFKILNMSDSEIKALHARTLALEEKAQALLSAS